jgi:hypothetical protein
MNGCFVISSVTVKRGVWSIIMNCDATHETWATFAVFLTLFAHDDLSLFSSAK